MVCAKLEPKIRGSVAKPAKYVAHLRIRVFSLKVAASGKISAMCQNVMKGFHSRRKVKVLQSPNEGWEVEKVTVLWRVVEAFSNPIQLRAVFLNCCLQCTMHQPIA